MYLTLCLCLSSRVLATACNLCNHLKYKKYKKYKPKLQNLQHWGWQNHQQKANTTYIGGFAVLFLDGMSKERKIQKDKVQSVKVEWKNTKNTNIQSAFLEVMEKYNKNTKCIFCNFTNKCKTNTNAIPKIQNTTKYGPNVSNIQNKKYKPKHEPESQPHVHFERQEPTCKIHAKPTCCIF